MSNFVPVSVVVPCYRCSITIVRAVVSIASQTRRPVEVILVDDASSDNTREALRSLADAYVPGWIRLVLLNHNVGVASARNLGWAAATQPYIAFLDADDAWHPLKLAIQYSFMSEHPDVVLSGHAHRLLKNETAPAWKVGTFEAHNINKWRLMRSNQFVTPSVMVRGDAKYRFSENQRHMEDHMLWLRLVSDGARVVKLQAALAAIYKQPFGDRGLSAQIWLMERGELKNYQQLHRDGFLARSEYLALVLYSILKFGRRLLIYVGYLRWKQ